MDAVGVEDVEIPWFVVEESLNGSFMLVAEYVKEPGTRVRIMPWKSYEGPGFCNCHQIKLWVDGSVEEECGMTPRETEFAHDAKKLAKEVMESV